MQSRWSHVWFFCIRTYASRGFQTTNIVSWLLAIFLHKISLGNRTQIPLKVLGVFGILDLPFYVVFPQIGLRHWIFLGSRYGPEPLTGARMMGISDPSFYLLVILSTLGLAFLYFKPFREKVWKNIRIISTVATTT